jgi:6-pyruvoyltetrahydropterin/6-carboxytetrahydropterin synthase
MHAAAASARRAASATTGRRHGRETRLLTRCSRVPEAFTLRKRFTFEAAHRLPLHDGKCRRLHGHSWVGWLGVSAASLREGGSEDGMVVDFGRLARYLEPMVEQYLDHQFLNETLPLASPTSESIARWIFGHLSEQGLGSDSVTIEETCTSACTYRRDG